MAGEVLKSARDKDRTIASETIFIKAPVEQARKMKWTGTIWVRPALFILILTIVLGCSSDKAFKSGITYTCDEGKSFALELYENVDIAFLTLSGKRFYLHRMPFASGVKYSDGNTTLWIKGQNASVEIEGQPEFKSCSVKPE
jgi:membrane-bound inhibitor of C-type lysozyme